MNNDIVLIAVLDTVPYNRERAYLSLSEWKCPL